MCSSDLIVIKFQSRNKPGVVDQRRRVLTSDEDLYNGCYAHLTYSALAYDYAGNRGVSFWVNSIQKVADGERIGRPKVAIEDEFDVLDVEDPIEGSDAADDGDL